MVETLSNMSEDTAVNKQPRGKGRPSIQPRYYTDDELKKMHNEGVDIIYERSHCYAKMKTPTASLQKLGPESRFRVDYMNMSGNWNMKNSNGQTVRCSVYSADDLINFSKGKSVNTEYVTSSGQFRNDHEMLVYSMSQAGTGMVRTMDIEKFMSKSKHDRYVMAFFDESVYSKAFDQVKREIKTKENQDIINKVMHKADLIDEEALDAEVTYS